MTAEGVPAFVFRGLARISHEDGVVLSYANEADLRDGIAALLWVSGNEIVRTEVAVPNCGRIDVLVIDDARVTAIEMKQSLTKVSTARRAFQQADMYLSYLKSMPEYRYPAQDNIESYVLAAQIDWAAAAPALQAFLSVNGMTVAHALNTLAEVGAVYDINDPLTWLKPSPARRDRSRERASMVADLMSLFGWADTNYVNHVDACLVREYEQAAAAS